MRLRNLMDEVRSSLEVNDINMAICAVFALRKAAGEHALDVFTNRQFHEVVNLLNKKDRDMLDWDKLISHVNNTESEASIFIRKAIELSVMGELSTDELMTLVSDELSVGSSIIHDPELRDLIGRLVRCSEGGKVFATNNLSLFNIVSAGQLKGCTVYAIDTDFEYDKIMAQMIGFFYDTKVSFISKEAYVSSVQYPYDSAFLMENWGRRNLDNSPYPAFDYPRCRSEVYPVESLLSRVNGLIHVAIPHSWLSSNVGDGYLLKQRLIRDRKVKQVIEFPASLLSNTSIPFSIVSIDPHNQFDTIKMINLSGPDFSQHRNRYRYLNRVNEINDAMFVASRDFDFVEDVPVNEIEECRYNLQPSRYVADQKVKAAQVRLKAFDVVLLEDIAEVQSCQTLKKLDRPTQDSDFRYILSTDIDDFGEIRVPKEPLHVEESSMRRMYNQVVMPGDLLLSAQGSIGVVGLAPESVYRLVAGGNFCILRLKKDICGHTPITLLTYLKSELGQTLLKQMVAGAAIPHIKPVDIRKMSVPKVEADDIRRLESLYSDLKKSYDEARMIEKNAKDALADSWS